MANSTYKLVYFNVRGRAEPIRFIFAVAGVKYEDFRFEKSEWPARKQTCAWGKVPLLEIDGETYAESNAICRFLARRFNLTGKNEFDALRCDEYVDVSMDLRAFWKPFFFETDETKRAALKKEFLEVHVSNYFPKFEKILEKIEGDFLLGTNYTWADLHLAHGLEFYEDTTDPAILKDYPKLRRLKEAVFNIPEIKLWVENRPKTAM